MCYSYTAAIFWTVFRANFILVNCYAPPKKRLEKTKSQINEINLLMKVIKISVSTTPTTANVKRRF